MRSRILAVILSLTIFASMYVVPYYVANGSFRANIHDMADVFGNGQVIDAASGMTIEDMKNISLYRYLELIYNSSNKSNDDRLVYNILFYVPIAFTALIIIFSLLNLPILAFLFSGIYAFLIILFNIGIARSSTLPNEFYTWGPARYLMCGLAILLVITAVGIFVEKKKRKKYSASREA